MPTKPLTTPTTCWKKTDAAWLQLTAERIKTPLPLPMDLCREIKPEAYYLAERRCSRCGRETFDPIK